MAKGTRVLLNRSKLEDLTLFLADGMLEVADDIIAVAKPPDATPFGEGLVTEGGTAVWVNGKKVGGEGNKPRGLRVQKPGVTAIAGFGFPGRFQEVGTIHQPPRPFVTPAANTILPNAPVTLSRAMRTRLAVAK